jgi:hypothetical protein
MPTQLAEAVLRGDTAAVRALSAGREGYSGGLFLGGATSFDIDAQDDDGMSSLMLAARDGRAEIVRLLLGAGASLDLQNIWGCAVAPHTAVCDSAGLTRSPPPGAVRRR